MNHKLLLPILITLCSLTTAQATLQFFTDQTAFQTALLSSTFHDFEGSSDITLGNSFAIGDARIISTNNSGIFGTSPNQFGSTSRIIYSGNSGGVRVEVDPGFRALGMEVGELFNSSSFNFVLKDQNGNTLDSGSLSVQHVGQFGGSNTSFYGWIADEDIASVQWDGGGFEAVDNLIYGNLQSTAIPEPSTYFLGFISLALIALVGKRN